MIEEAAPTPPAPVLEVRSLRATHGQLVAVRDVSLALAPGEAVALIGANGAGKTTLLRCLAGVHPAAGGHVRLAGDDVTAWPAHRRVQRGLALVPEGRRLFGEMTVRENLRVAAEHRGKRAAAAGRGGTADGAAGGAGGGAGGDGRAAGSTAATPWTLERVLHALPMLAGFLERPAAALSGGQRQAAAIARALMTNPEVLLLDEVSLGLSPLVVEEVFANLRQLRRDAGTTLLLVEQDLARALAFADRVLCLREGRVVLEACCADVTRAQVTEAYFGVMPEAGNIEQAAEHAAEAAP
ncbi:MAG: ATP-binding cassette domain-containing protein [Burkholderiales bacterium]|nr:ATP-binding cassette domain-containing protein [Burkholderiales bacterium]